MIETTTEQLLQVIGAQQVEIHVLRARLLELEAQADGTPEAEPEPAPLDGR